MTKIVLDANFLVALFDSKDKWHAKAKTISHELPQGDYDLIHLDFILAEVISVIARRLQETKRSARFTEVFSEIRSKITPEKITWASVSIRIWFDEILSLIATHNGDLNFNDAFMAVYMQKAQIGRLLSFDQDFDQIHWIIRLFEVGQIKNLHGHR